MATTIKLKNGSGAPAASSLLQAEPAFDLTNKRLYTEDANGSVIEVGSNPTALTLSNWTIQEVSNNLLFSYNGNTVFKVMTTGAIVAEGDITAFGTA
jgi:hypothetical protein